MNKKLGVLKTVTKSFNLKDHGRSDGNGRGYLIDSVKRMRDSPLFKERLKLGELYGYFGHNLRQLAGKMDLDETTIVQFEGKPVVIETVPSNRTVAFDVSDDGVVTHTQEILDTPSGRAVAAMLDAGVGGWSWAVNGIQGIAGAVARTFHGFDFVKHPSYIDLEKQQAMFESVGVSNEADLYEKMFESAGFDAGQSEKLISLWSRRAPSIFEYQEITQEVMMLESALSNREAELARELTEKESRSIRMLEAVRQLPIFTTERQLQAITNMASEEDKQIVISMFEGLKNQFPELPLGPSDNSTINMQRQLKPTPDADRAIMFDTPNNPFAK